MISVCIAVFNGEKYIQRQLNTILLQLGQTDELIISDDSSTDSTIALIKAFGDDRIRLLENANFKSPIYNIENALKLARGKYIFLADQDDVWLPDRIYKVKEKLQEYDLVVCDAFVVDQEEKLIHKSFYEWNGSGPGFWRNLKKNSFLGCSMAFNQKILHAALPFPKRIAMHDVWIGLLAVCNGKVLFLDERLIYYRRHSNNFVASILRDDAHPSDFGIIYKIGYRLELLIQILKRCFILKVASKRRKKVF